MRFRTAKARYLPAFCLAVASPMIAELLSSSTPPLQFFIPWVFALFTLLYGSCCLLIREWTVRWGTGWTGIVVLGAAFGILDEGILTRAFFDPAWPSLGPLAGHGRWLGINVIWTEDAIIYHAIFSMTVPILVVYLLFPASVKKPWLSRRQLWIVSVLLALTVTVFIRAGNKYPVSPVYLGACIAALLFFIVLARFAGVRPDREHPPITAGSGKFFALGFGGLAAVLFQMYVLPPLARLPAVTFAVLLAIIISGNRLIRKWTRNGTGWSRMQQFSLIAGMLACLSILGGLQEINPARSPRPVGMSLVAIGCIVFLLWMRFRVQRLEMLALVPHMAMAASAGVAGAARSFDLYTGSSSVMDQMDAPAHSSGTEVSLLVRAFEIAFASGVLIVTSPIMLVLTILIRRGTPGKALFSQQRLGKDCVPFKFVKFRTLYSDARECFPELYAYQYTPVELASLKFKIVNDPRVTPQGEWMRKSTLDELPNFWNVLTGEMALVGPRPEIPEMLPYYTPEMWQKFSVRPGVTGLAQISGRGRLSLYDTVKLDIEYVRKRSLAMDAKILALTAYKMVTRDGAF